MLRKLSIALIVFLFMLPPFFRWGAEGISYAELTKETGKREKLRNAINRGVLSVYDIPFEVYVKLEMWTEIGFIFEANNKNMIKHKLPGLYYSRPYIVNDKVWIFENAADGEIYIFDPDTLKVSGKLKNDAYAKYAGGVRKIFGYTVISGGSEIDVDAAVIWDTDINEVRTIKLGAGHYVGSIEVEGDQLYIGSCGEVVNAWDYDTLEFSGNYSANKDNADWNKKECITGIKIINDKLIGVGEKTVFVWNLEDQNLLKTYLKALNNSIVFFYKNYMIEYKNNRFAVRNLEDEKIIKKVKAEKSIEDLIVTSKRILANHRDELLILALRHNKGLLFYDFKTLKLIKKIEAKGESLTAYKHTIFATDDRNIYKYDIAYKDEEKYQGFLETIRPDNIVLNNNIYYQLLRRLLYYPEVIEKSGISKNFLALHELTVSHSFKYGKIGERFVTDEADVYNDNTRGKSANPGNGYKEDVYGYKAVYEVRNTSDDRYFVSMAAAWSGEYGKASEYDDEPWETEDNSKRGFTKQSFFIPPHKGKYKNQFELGEKEPINLLIYPMRIEKVSEGYYDGLMNALSHKNGDVSLIDKYLGDSLIKDWHDKLTERKNEILKNKEKDSGFWPF